jgi:hypothetical protein
MSSSLPLAGVLRLAGFGRCRVGEAVEHMYEVIPGYTRAVKTAISIPDETFTRAERHAAVLGVSRSEFFTRAARRYMEQLEAETLTARIDVAMDMVWPEGIEVDYLGHGHGHEQGRAARAESW